MQVAYEIIDVFKLWSSFKAEMLIDMYLDTGRAEGQETASAAAEVSKQFIIMKSTSDFG